MKATDLKYPYAWENRHPALENGVLFIPKHYDKHALLPALFEKGKPVFVEYCSGNGAWILEKARTCPDSIWVAVERRFDRVRKIWVKMKNQNLTNVLIVCGDAEIFSRYYVEEGSIEGIYVNFPDPWPKKKHSKNRLFQAPFVQDLSHIVRKGGSATLVTDDPTYTQQMIETMRENWEAVFPEPYYVTDWPAYGDSYFCSLWLSKERTIHYLQFRNTK